MNTVLARQSQASADFRSLVAPQTFRYGPSEDETLDVFASDKAGNAPVHVHIHGGGWRSLTKDDVSFAAPVFTSAGAIYVALNFSVIPAVRLPGMVEQVQRAIGWLHGNARRFGGDPARIHLSGHSAGAHMASVLLTTNWSDRGLPADVIKSGMLMSGMYDLAPVMLSVRSTYVKISPQEQALLSAVQHVDQIRAPVTVVYGDKETPEFKRQAEHFFNSLRRSSKTAELICVDGFNHFEVMDVFADPNSSLAAVALNYMAG